MRQLWAAADTDRSGALRDRCGIVCPQCGMTLEIFQAAANVYSFGAMLLVLPLAYFLMHIIPAHNKETQLILTLLVFVPLVSVLLRFTPCFARVARATNPNELTYPLSPKPLEPESTEARNQRELAEAIANAQNDKSRGISPATWQCASCGEENPGEFDICWKCQKDRAPASI
jgi:hypothetical protein